MPDRFDAMEVRTFKTRADVEALEGFREDNPVSKQNYGGLVGDYDFSEPTKCCFEPKAGDLCRQAHNKGYVVFLVDLTVTIIGNVCADRNFEAQTKLAQDKNLYANLKRRAETQTRLAELLQGKEAAQTQIRDMYTSLTATSRRMDSLLLDFGHACTNQLRMLARGGLGRVMVTGVRVRREKFEGKDLVDRDRIAIPVGTLRGIEVLRTDHFTAVKTGLRSVTQAFETAATFTDEVKTSELARVTGAIADLPRVLETGKALMDAEAEFLASDWTCLPFLVRGDSDRTKLARVAINHAGKPGGRDKAKQWLQDLESDLRERNGVDRLDIAY